MEPEDEIPGGAVTLVQVTWTAGGYAILHLPGGLGMPLLYGDEFLQDRNWVEQIFNPRAVRKLREE